MCDANAPFGGYEEGLFSGDSKDSSKRSFEGCGRRCFSLLVVQYTKIPKFEKLQSMRSFVKLIRVLELLCYWYQLLPQLASGLPLPGLSK